MNHASYESAAILTSAEQCCTAPLKSPRESATGGQTLQSLAGLRTDLEHPVGIFLGLGVVLARHGKSDEVHQQLGRAGVAGQQLAVDLGGFVELAELMQRHGLSEQGPVLTGAGSERLVEMRQGLIGLAQLQQAQAAPGVGLPQARIERKGGFEGAAGLVELALTFQGEPEIIVRRGVVRVGRDHLGVAGGRLSPLLLFEAQVAQAGSRPPRVFPRGRRRLPVP